MRQFAKILILTEDRKSQPIPKSVNVIAPENIFLEEGDSRVCDIKQLQADLYI